MWRLLAVTPLLYADICSGRALESEGFLSSADIPRTGEDWISLSADAEFLPAASHSNPGLRRAQRRFLGYTDNFVDGNTYYDEYSQAWRVLGWYIDCTSYENHRKRKLANANDDENGSLYCARYLLWAAYVDLGYQGGGIGEYQFFDDESGAWDDSTCQTHGGTRCVLMDCHLSTTHFKLLGYFKQYDYDDFFEQLFKHEAYCIWSESEYEFMETYREWWPAGCQETGQTSGGNSIYLDIKPSLNGDMGLGLYVDAACTQSYEGRTVKLENMVDSYGGASIDDHINSWNSALGVFKKCQPCKAYSLAANNDGNYNGDDVNGGVFQCDDKAGYQNVNQCMKFQTHTKMMKASYHDVELASRQGTISRTYLNDVLPSFMESWGFFGLSAIVFLVGLTACITSAKPRRRRRGLARLSSTTLTVKSNSEPLMSTG